MFITDAIAAARREYPSEYDESEMLVWCDEVSASLAVESRIVYREIRPPLAADGTALLPSGVRTEHIVKVLAGGREVPLRDVRTRRGRLSISPWLCAHEIPPEPRPALCVVYEQPYEPIRQSSYTGPAALDAAADKLTISDCEFLPGDVLTVTDRSVSPAVTASEISLVDVEPDPDDLRGFTLTFGSGELTALGGGTSIPVCEITRVITDRTVCDPPFDVMYKYYILARVAECQHDSDMYDRYAYRYDSMLGRWKEWLSARVPNAPTRLINVW